VLGLDPDPARLRPRALELAYHPGAPPAAYGGAAGAVIAGQTGAPSPEPHRELNLRLIDAGALIEYPFDGGRESVMVSGDIKSGGQ